jgi:hypothetical protein
LVVTTHTNGNHNTHPFCGEQEAAEKSLEDLGVFGLGIAFVTTVFPSTCK